MNHSDMPFTLPPFPGFPSASRFVSLGPVMESVTRVARSVIAREAISLVIGPPGTGKSLLCALLVKEFIESRDVVSVGETTINDEASFYRFLLNRLGVAIADHQRHDLEWMVDQHLTGPDANPNGLVLIVDEAASLTVEVLEAVRRMTNIMRDGMPMVSAVMVGCNKLDDTLTSPKMESFVQRIASRCYLHPLSAGETRDYIRGSIESCDASADETITDSAIAAIHHAASGVPRLINQLMTEAIDCAADLDESLIGDHTVDRAWATLQQLPGPMIEEPELQGESTSIEFGELTAMDETDSAVPQLELTFNESLAPSDEDELLIGLIEPEPENADDAAEVEMDAAETASTEAAAETASPEAFASPEMLFGDFEEEECIDVGTTLPEPTNAGGGMDLESMLHSEIVSLSHFAAENTNLLDEDQSIAAEPSMIQEDRLDTDLESAEQTSTEQTSTEQTSPEQTSTVQPRSEFPNVVWYDEPAAEETSSPEDDSDLLWITEDVDVEGREIRSTPEVTPHRIDSANSDADSPKLTVDYRELLEKMRKHA